MNTAIKAPEQMNEQELFLSILHHDAFNRNNYFVRFELDKAAKKRGEENFVVQVWNRDTSLPLCTYNNTQYDMYIALHSFNKRKRTGNRIFTYNAFYFDLDWHYPECMHEYEERLNNTLKILDAAYDAGEIPKPTMVTNTGRGLGIFYVLNKSIANTSNTAKQVRFFEYIREEYAKKLDSLMSKNETNGTKMLEMDWKVVRDKARVARLPLTNNLSSGTVCRIHEVNRINGNVLYYSLSDLVKYIPTYGIYEDAKEEQRKSIANQKIVDFTQFKKESFLYQRLKKIERAQEVFKNQREGCRELICFHYYNTAKQIYGENEAVIMLESFHQRFTYSIGGAELFNIVRSVSKAEDKEGNIKGYYKISDRTIKEHLELEGRVASGEITQAQMDYIGLCDSVKSYKRRKAKEETKKKKDERNKRIIGYIKENPDTIYAEIADLFGVSVRTINNIVKKYNVYRYANCQKATDEASVCDANNSVKELEKSTKMDGFESGKSKTQKNVLLSSGVMNSITETNSNTTKDYLQGRTPMPKSQHIAELSEAKARRVRRRPVVSIGAVCDKAGKNLSADMLLFDKRVSVTEEGWVSMDCHELFEEPDWLYWLGMGLG